MRNCKLGVMTGVLLVTLIFGLFGCAHVVTTSDYKENSNFQKSEVAEMFNNDIPLSEAKCFEFISTVF